MLPHAAVQATRTRRIGVMATEATVLEKPFHLRQLVTEIDRVLAA